MLTRKMVYIMAVNGCRFEYSDTLNRSMPHLSMSSNIFDNSSSQPVSTPNLGIFVKLFVCVNVGFRTPLIWDMARAGDVLPANACIELLVLLLFRSTTSVIGDGIAKPVDEPDEMAAGLCLVFSSNCKIGNSSSSCLSESEIP